MRGVDSKFGTRLAKALCTSLHNNVYYNKIHRRARKSIIIIKLLYVCTVIGIINYNYYCAVTV